MKVLIQKIAIILLGFAVWHFIKSGYADSPIDYVNY